LTVTENLRVEPSELLAQPPSPVPQGMVALKISDEGYALAAPAYVIVRAPASARIGTTAEIRMTAQAEWLGQGGGAAMKQERDFDFTVKVVAAPREFSERVLGEPTNWTARLLPALAVAAVFIVFLVWLFLVRKRRQAH
jgi:hypothetical protein